ncbi:BrnT family toxin [Nitratireductor sp. CH_MIT9313-5]|uniref:BrnT family toxin n=1 Tax=Nitratireductor sp. CH_MIT9313-5 TaxID=3107764 RepID=UPI00300887D8
MQFECEPQKSAANKSKHGIDFDEAQALWEDDRVVVVPARGTDEPRFLVVGMIGVQHWAAMCTTRDELIRIISVRRARSEEIEFYEGE